MCAIFQVVFGENEQFGAVRCLIFPEETTCIKEPIAEYIFQLSCAEMLCAARSKTPLALARLARLSTAAAQCC